MGKPAAFIPETIELMKAINDGEDWDIYHVYTWYANNRPSIGKGSRVPVPEWLNWDLWQGPAPRADYSDIYVHYNWHWFWDWGTGESCNNGAHELDIGRWAVGGEFPSVSMSMHLASSIATTIGKCMTPWRRNSLLPVTRPWWEGTAATTSRSSVAVAAPDLRHRGPCYR